MADPDPDDDLDGDRELELDKANVQRRIDDWLQRLQALMAQIKSWADQKNWGTRPLQVSMHEELMHIYEIPATEQPGLTLTGPNNSIVSIKPKGLWVIGANGRVDIYSPSGIYTLVDAASNYEPAQWLLYRVGDKSQGQPFTPNLIETMVGR